ncbi:MAG: hypothetical protein RMA76_43475 [Deltaproteobacteria bacterium]|jgi:hypothetical protein
MSRVPAWLFPASSAFLVTAIVVLFGVLASPGCQTRCTSNFDCGGSFCSQGRCETECFADIDCQRPPECQDNPTACVPKGLRCNGIGRCVGAVRLRPPVEGTRDVFTPPNDGIIDGWDDRPGSGRAFIVNQIAIAGDDRGFDIDGVCTEDGCIDNYLHRLGDLGNDQIRQGLLGGESLLLLELAGLEQNYLGDDSSMTVKIYGARDADDPFFPANNFKIPPGHSTCCEFKINPQSLAGIPSQARARAPARIERGRLRSLAPVPIQFTLTVGVPPHPEIRLERVLISGRLPSNLAEFSEGLLGGAVPVNTLAQTENPYCRTVSPRCPIPFTDSTLIDLVANLLGPQPDVDLDFDGLECVRDMNGDGAIDVCCDGADGADTCGGSSCPGNAVAAVDPAKPASCALHPQVADGYSVGITFTAVAAKIVGVGQ